MIINDAARITLTLSGMRLLNETTAATRGHLGTSECEELDAIAVRVSTKLEAMIHDNDLFRYDERGPVGEDEQAIQMFAEAEPAARETLFGLMAWLTMWEQYKRPNGFARPIQDTAGLTSPGPARRVRAAGPPGSGSKAGGRQYRGGAAMSRCSHEWRVKVELFLDIPERLAHRLAKTRLRDKDVRVEGANWPKAYTYCSKCGSRRGES